MINLNTPKRLLALVLTIALTVSAVHMPIFADGVSYNDIYISTESEQNAGYETDIGLDEPTNESTGEDADNGDYPYGDNCVGAGSDNGYIDNDNEYDGGYNENNYNYEDDDYYVEEEEEEILMPQASIVAAIGGIGDFTVPVGVSEYVTENITGNVTVEGTLIFDAPNLTITGTVIVQNGGTFEMFAGTITGAGSSGVIVTGEGSTFEMSGGTIEGNSADIGGGVYISAGGSFTMPAESTGSIRNNTADRFGGGVHVINSGSTFTMRGGEIAHNILPGSESGGAGVRVEDGAVFNLYGGRIHNNTSHAAGGGVQLVRGVFANTAEPEFYMHGGYIEFNRSFGGNGNSTGGGGGVRVFDGTFTMNDGVIRNNETANSNGGGGVSVRTTFIMNGGQIYNNETTNNGGGVALQGGRAANTGLNIPAVTGSFTMAGGTIGHTNPALGNRAVRTPAIDNTGNGGGVHVTGGGSFVMQNGSILGNTAAQNGGGVFVTGAGSSFTMNGEDAMIQRNAANGAAPPLQGGGGVFVMGAGSIFDLIDGTIYDNTAIAGAGVFVMDNAEFGMSGGQIYRNTANSNNTGAGGGGVRMIDNASFVMTGGSISRNTTLSHGGGVMFNRGSVMRMYGGEMSINESGRMGGAVHIGSGGNETVPGRFYMLDGTIQHNEAAENGGGIHVATNAFMRMETGTIYGNEAINGNGGGVNVNIGAVFELIDGVIQNNTAALDGGGVSVTGANTEFTMTGGTIEDNTAGQNGGGIAASHITFTISGGEIRGNTADNNGGGIFIDRSANLTATDVTIGGALYEHLNMAQNGGGIAVDNAMFTMSGDSVIVNNGALNSGGGVAVMNNGSFTMHDGNMHTNGAYYGGGVSVDGSAFTMNGGAIEFCSAIEGGGVWVANSSTFNMAGGIINDNLASYAGGVGVIDGSTFTMSALAAVYNNAALYGGGVKAASYATVTMFGGIIESNEASYGGGVWVSDTSTFTANAGSIINNLAGADGGGIFTETYDYSRVLSAGAYSNVTTSEEVVFFGNTAGNGSFTPPSNWNITPIRGDGTSPSVAAHQVHQLNNYDVNFRLMLDNPSLEKSAQGTGITNVGETVEYTITVRNNYNIPLTGQFVVTDRLDSRFVSFAAGSMQVTRGTETLTAGVDFNYTAADGLITVTFNGLPASSTTVIGFDVRVSAGSEGAVIGNRANLQVPAGDDGITPPPIRTPVVEVYVNPDIAKAANVSSAVVGDEVEYTITVINNGEHARTGDFIVTDVLDTAFVQFVLGSLTVTRDGVNIPSAEFTADLSVAGTVQVTFHGLPAESETVIAFEVEVLAAAADEAVTNVAVLQVPPRNPGDTLPPPIQTPPVNIPVTIGGNGSGGGGNGTPNLVLNKTADIPNGGHVRIGQTVTYTISAWNIGSGAQANVLIEDTIPDGMTFVQGSAVARVDGSVIGTIIPSITGQTISWIVSSIPAGTSVEVSFQVTVDQMPEGTYEMVFRNVAGVNGFNTPPVYLTSRRLFKGPDRMQVSVGETINWTLRGFHNPADDYVANFTIVDMPGQGLNFQSASIPAFNNGEGITYDVRYRVAGSNEWHTQAAGVDASRPFTFSLPQTGSLHYTDIGLFFGDVPVEFGLGDEIVMTFVVGNNAPGNILINRFFIRYDYIEEEGGSPYQPIVVPPGIPGGAPSFGGGSFYGIPPVGGMSGQQYGVTAQGTLVQETDQQDFVTLPLVYGVADGEQLPLIVAVEGNHADGSIEGNLETRINPLTGDGFSTVGIILSAAGLLLSFGGMFLMIRKTKKKNVV